MSGAGRVIFAVSALLVSAGCGSSSDSNGKTPTDTDGGSDATATVDARGDAPMATDAPTTSCEDTVGFWKSDDDTVFAVIEPGCIITNVCDLSDDTHATGKVTSTQIELDLGGGRQVTFDYTLSGDTLTVHGAGPGGSDLVLRPLPPGESIPAACPPP